MLSGQYLAGALEASDYTHGLATPGRAGEYIRTGETAHGSPFDGVAFSYARPEFQFDEYVVSIYPIRATSWIDYAAVLAGEMQLIRADFEAALDAGDWRDVRFGDQQQLLVNSPGGGSVGILQPVNLVDLNGEPFIVRIYLIIREDKVVALSNFVPAKLRQQQREYDRM